MTLDPQIVGPLCGAFVAGCGAIIRVCGTFLSWLRDRARQRWIAASPEDREKLGPIPPPYPDEGRAAPTAAIIIGAVLAVGIPFASGRAHPIATLERIGVLQLEHPAAERPPGCTSATCPAPAHCTASGCEGNALPPPPKPQQGPARASTKHPPRLESAVTQDGASVGEQSALAALPEWVRR